MATEKNSALAMLLAVRFGKNKDAAIASIEKENFIMDCNSVIADKRRAVNDLKVELNTLLSRTEKGGVFDNVRLITETIELDIKISLAEKRYEATKEKIEALIKALESNE